MTPEQSAAAEMRERAARLVESESAMWARSGEMKIAGLIRALPLPEPQPSPRIAECNIPAPAWEEDVLREMLAREAKPDPRDAALGNAQAAFRNIIEVARQDCIATYVRMSLQERLLTCVRLADQTLDAIEAAMKGPA